MNGSQSTTSGDDEAPVASDMVGSTEICDELDINRSTLSRWVDAGRITPALRLGGKHGAFVFHRADFDRLKAEIVAQAKEPA